MKAWHFCAVRDGKPTLGDGSPALGPGEIETYTGPLEMCQSGLHASKRPIDALQFAPGAWVRRVELVGKRLDEHDKSVARKRRIIASADATAVLHEFACCVAEAALCLAEVTDQRSWDAIEAKLAWLRGEITDQQLAAARAAARNEMNTLLESMLEELFA